MGFFKNALDEFGTKSGKALGNKLYGEHADDLRIGVRNVDINKEEASGKGSYGDYDDAIIEQKIEQMERKEVENCKKNLQMFYDSFEFDPNNVEDIEAKALAIVSWIDSVDKNSKDKKTVVSKTYGRNVVIQDDNKSKEKVLTNKLAFAVERLAVLKLEPSRLQYLTDKLNSYNNRKIAKKKRTRIILLSIFTPIICAGVIVGLIFALPNAKRRDKDCKAKMLKFIQKGDLDAAFDVMMSFQDYASSCYNEARDILCKELLSNDKLDMAIKIERNKQDRYSSKSDELISAYMIERGMYDDAKEYLDNKSYTIAVVKHMCKNGKINEARRFAKRQSAEYSYDKSEFLREMNVIINTYL